MVTLSPPTSEIGVQLPAQPQVEKLVVACCWSAVYSAEPCYHDGFFINEPQISYLCVHLFGVLRRFQHCTGHITTGSWKGRGNQYIQFVRVLYCKLPTNGKQLPAFPLEVVLGIEPRPQRWEVRVLPLCHRGPFVIIVRIFYE